MTHTELLARLQAFDRKLAALRSDLERLTGKPTTCGCRHDPITGAMHFDSRDLFPNIRLRDDLVGTVTLSEADLRACERHGIDPKDLAKGVVRMKAEGTARQRRKA